MSLSACLAFSTVSLRWWLLKVLMAGLGAMHPHCDPNPGRNALCPLRRHGVGCGSWGI